MKKYLLAPLGAVLFACPAFAQDGSAAHSFTGPRVEAHFGADLVNFEASFDDGDEEISDNTDEQGLVLGVEAGFDFPVGTNLIAGAYVAADFPSTSACEEVFGDDEGCVAANRNIAIGGRLGTRLGNSAMIYGKAGFSLGRLKIEYDDFEDIIEDAEESENVGGYHLGGGVEFGLGDNAYARFDYMFTDYDGAELVEDDVTASAGFTRHQATLGFGFRF